VQAVRGNADVMHAAGLHFVLLALCFVAAVAQIHNEGDAETLQFVIAWRFRLRAAKEGITHASGVLNAGEGQFLGLDGSQGKGRRRCGRRSLRMKSGRNATERCEKQEGAGELGRTTHCVPVELSHKKERRATAWRKRAKRNPTTTNRSADKIHSNI